MRPHPSVLASLAVFTLSLFVTPSPAAAEEWPSLRPGRWEFTRTLRPAGASGKPTVVRDTRCVDPVADMKLQQARLTRMGCRYTPMVRSGSTYAFTSQCKLMGMDVRSKSVLTVESPTAYRLHVDTVEDGVAGKEDLVARRVGDCPK